LKELSTLSELLGQRNRLDKQIATLIGRPAQTGHLGEFIASRIFDVELAPSAANRGVDGWFRSGPLIGRSVNIKWYPKRENLLNLIIEGPEFYLILAGPRAPAVSSRGTFRPLVIQEVFLFDAIDLLATLSSRGRTIGIATSTRARDWESARIFPTSDHSRLGLTSDQVAALELFRRHEDR
jgi:hypothetical protein